MRVRVWGCRGSVATPGPDTVRFLLSLPNNASVAELVMNTRLEGWI